MQIEDVFELRHLERIVFVELICTGNPFTRHADYKADIKAMFGILRTIVSITSLIYVERIEMPNNLSPF